MNQESETKTKKCPFCGEEIIFEAVKCKHCGEWLNRRPIDTQRTKSSDHIGNTGIYLITLFCGLFLCVIGVAFGAANLEAAAGGFIILGAIALLVATIYYWVLFYQVWRFVINESYRNSLEPSIETPGKVIGFLFIPFFNLYWGFRVFGKLPIDYNVLARAKSSDKKMSMGLGIAIPILILFSFIPYVNFATSFVTFFILFPLFINQAVSLCKELV